MVGAGVGLVLVAILFPDPLSFQGNIMPFPYWARNIVGLFGFASILFGVFLKSPKGTGVTSQKESPQHRDGPTLQANIDNSNFGDFNQEINIVESQEKQASVYPHEKPQYAVREIPERYPTHDSKKHATFLMLLISNDGEARIDAKDVSAELIFNSKGYSVGPLVAAWENVEETDRGRLNQLIDQVRNLDIQVDLPANGLPARIILAIKYQEDQNGFAFSRESTGIENWTNPGLMLSPGDYELAIELRGKNIEPNPTILHYELDVLGAGDTFNLKPLPKEEL